MWPFTSCNAADACVATDPNAVTAATILALTPFVAVFAIVNVLVVRHVYPKLSQSYDGVRDGDDHLLPSHAPAALRQVHAEHGAKSWNRRGAAWTFGTTVGLAATLGALVLAEIVEVVNPTARDLGVSVAEPALLFLVVGLIPWLECRSIVVGAGGRFRRNSRGQWPRATWLLQIVLFSGWLFTFWTVGSVVPTGATRILPEGTESMAEPLTKACLERVGVVGISLMALLAGFASVSSPWHTLFGGSAVRQRRPVTEADVNRKQAGVDATNELLLTKRHRLQALERKLSDPNAPKASSGFVGRMMGSIRGASSEEAEVRGLRMEIAGLETMEANLSSNLALMKGQRAATARASTLLGRLFLIPTWIFSAYCLYRIIATTLTTFHRASSPSASFASSDPINRFLGLLARHWDPKLDQLAWARTISFALSGVMLLASANSVVQTFHLFAKWTPGLLRHAQANLALAAGQVAGTYVISTTLLLRSQLPREVGSAVGGVLHGALTSPGFVDGWFEGWFLLGGALTVIGIWVGRKLSGPGDEQWDDYGTEEMGAKRM